MFLFLFRLQFNRKTTIIVCVAVLFLTSSSIFSQEYKKITAQKGDGIYMILKQNGLPPSEYLDLFIKLNKTNLGKNNTLIIGRTYRLPVKSQTRNELQNSPPIGSVSQEKIVYEIFGAKYKEVAIISKELSQAVFYLMSGHGGPDPGAIGSLNGHLLCEDEYAYDVTLRLARNLIERGATVYMIIRDPNDGIRDDQFLKPDRDEVCFPDNRIPLNQIARLRQGTEAVNKLYIKNKDKFQRLVVIHVDSRSQKENIDVFFYHDKRSDAGKKLANTLKETFGQRYARHQPSRGYNGSVSERNLYVIKNTYAPSVFIELGNINHTRDQQRFIFSDNRQAVSNWLRDGLMEDYKKSIK